MKLKLTKAEMIELDVIMDVVIEDVTLKQEGSILHLLLIAIFERFHLQIITRLLILRNRYNFTIEPATALAFLLYFKNANLNPEKFADNLILKLINQIHQKYGNKNCISHDLLA